MSDFVRFDHVQKTYHMGEVEIHALRDATFTVDQGELCVIVGPSGAGKTTLLNILGGMDTLTGGKIFLGGEEISAYNTRQLTTYRRRDIGFVFQFYNLVPNLTALENVELAAQICPHPLDAAQVLRSVGLEQRMGNFPAQLSGGEQQRVALGRILAAQPEVILLDEPFSALDSHLKWQLELELRDILAEFSGPVVWVTHDRGEAFRNCGRVCVLEEGRSSPTLEMHRLLSDPGTVAAARLSGCRNCLPCAPGPRPGTVVLPDWGLTLACAAPWRAEIAAVGIRSDSVRPAEPGEENAFRCQVVRVTEDVGHMAVLLRPEHARAGAPLLGMRADKGCWRALGDPTALWVAVAPGELMLLTP